ncbi:MAG TPA: hypothetical protein VFI56_11970, partial [Vicinamibacterales bacterium]|nr:hypothetical protein [Vicinamibacterales bacterium]
GCDRAYRQVNSQRNEQRIPIAQSTHALSPVVHVRCVGAGLGPHLSDEHDDDDASEKKNLVGIELMTGMETEIESNDDNRRQPSCFDDATAESGRMAAPAQSSLNAGCIHRALPSRKS